MFFNNSLYIAWHGAAVNFLTWTTSFFLLRLFCLSTRFLSVLTIESSAIHWLNGLTNLFPSFWQFLVHFWMLWMLVTVHKPCHVPYASRITTWEIILTERVFCVSKERFRPWSHLILVRPFLITYDKTLLAVRPQKVTRRKKRKKN